MQCKYLNINICYSRMYYNYSGIRLWDAIRNPTKDVSDGVLARVTAFGSSLPKTSMLVWN